MGMMKWLSLIAGGVIGTVSRYLLAWLVYRGFGDNFPYGTLAVNLTGCAILGFILGINEKKFFLTHDMQILLVTGFCGAFTTFSALILESSNLMRGGAVVPAFLNLLISIVAGLLVFKLGLALTSFI